MPAREPLTRELSSRPQLWVGGLAMAAYAAAVAVGVGALSGASTGAAALAAPPSALPHSDRVVALYESYRGGPAISVAPRKIEDWRARTASLDLLAGLYLRGPLVLAVGDDMREARVITADPELFEILGARRRAGRWFGEGERLAGGAIPVVIVSELAQRRFGGDQAAIDRVVLLGARSAVVVGVAELPSIGEAVEVVAPFDAFPHEAWHDRGAHSVAALARLARGVTPHQAEQEMDTVADDLGRLHPATDLGWSVRVKPLAARYTERLVAPTRALRSDALLLGILALVVALAVAVASRRRFWRQAATASPWQVARGMLRAAAGPTAVGAVVGVVGSLLVARWLAGSGLPAVPWAETPGLQLGPAGWGLLLAGVIWLVTATACTIATTWRGVGGETDRIGGIGPRTSGQAVLALLALALVAWQLVRVGDRRSELAAEPAPVFPAADSTAAVTLKLPEVSYWGRPVRQRDFYTALLSHLSAIEHIEGLGLIDPLPFGGRSYYYTADDPPPLSESDWPLAYHRIVTPGSIEMLGVTLLAGRTIAEVDSPTSEPVAVVNRILAEAELGGADRAVGAFITVADQPAVRRRVVGVLEALPAPDQPDGGRAIYVPLAQHHSVGGTVLVRSTRGVEAAVAVTVGVARRLDPDVAVERPRRLVEVTREARASRRASYRIAVVAAVAAGCLALLALLALLVRIRWKRDER